MLGDSLVNVIVGAAVCLKCSALIKTGLASLTYYDSFIWCLLPSNCHLLFLLFTVIIKLQ